MSDVREENLVEMVSMATETRGALSIFGRGMVVVSPDSWSSKSSIASKPASRASQSVAPAFRSIISITNPAGGQPSIHGDSDQFLLVTVANLLTEVTL